MKRLGHILVSLLTLTLTAPALADYQAGVDAYETGDFRKAMAEWLPLAEGGDAVAQNSVGALYDHGLGVDEDDTEAARWYQMAADQSLPLAMRNLGGMYAGGHGLPYDKDQAEFWYKKAAELGDQVAIKRLAALDPTYSAPAAPVPEPTSEPMTVAGADETAAAGETSEPIAPTTETAPTPQAEPAETPAIAEAPAEKPAPASGAGDDLQYGEGTATATTSVPAVQQASVAPAAPVAGNWLIGAWEGPSLGCPPGGGLEFAAGETRSYFGGKVAASLPVAYQAAGDTITVVSTGVDGVGRTYQYRQTAPDRFVIAAVPPEMPATMIGVEYRRCDAAPLQSAAVAAPTTAPATVPAPQPQAKPFVPTTDDAATLPTVPQSTAEPATQPAQPAPTAPAQSAVAAAAPAAGGSAQQGWDAFSRGDYQGALAVWTPLAEAGDTNMQLLVGSIYDYGQGVPQDDAEAARWYQMAAERGSAKGQYQLGAIYARSAQVKDPTQGYKWLTIAARTIGTGNVGGVTADQATTLRALVAMDMTEAQITEAERQAKSFKIKQ